MHILHAVKHKAFYHLDGTEPAPDLSSHHVVCKLVFHLTKQNHTANAVTAFFHARDYVFPKTELS